MSELESIEKLRESSHLDDNKWTLASGDVVYMCNHEHGDPNAVNWGEQWRKIADEIEAEIAERYMPLPCDADGVPIRMGDTVEGELLYDNATVKGTVTTYHIHGDDEPGTVYIKVKPTEDTWTIKELQFRRCRHVKPRTLEDVLRECAEAYACGADIESGTTEMFGKYADEIRAMFAEVDR